MTTHINGLLKLTGNRAEFDLVTFLKAHKDVLGITDAQAEQVSTTLRMTHTGDLVHIADVSYLEDITFLEPTQMAALWRLVQEVQRDPAYNQESSKQLDDTAQKYVVMHAAEVTRERARVLGHSTAHPHRNVEKVTDGHSTAHPDSKPVERTKLKDRVRRQAARPTEEEKNERRDAFENWQRHSHGLRILLAQLQSISRVEA